MSVYFDPYITGTGAAVDTTSWQSSNGFSMGSLGSLPYNDPVSNQQATNVSLLEAYGNAIAQDQNFLGQYGTMTNNMVDSQATQVNNEIYSLGSAAQNNISQAQNNNCGFLGCGGGLFGSGMF